MSLPIFFFAALCLVCLLEMMSVQTMVKSALCHAAKEMAEEAYTVPFVVSGSMEREMVRIIGEERLDRSMVYGGSGGLHCQAAPAVPGTTIMDVSVKYKLKIPVPVFRLPLPEREERIRIKGWTGYESGGFGDDRDEIVYITENGVVYHKDAQCSYLDLSIRSVSLSAVADLRNESGGKYYPCSCALHLTGGGVYITDTGDRYHASLNCHGLKRTVYAVKLSEVYGRGGCSRCVK